MRELGASGVEAKVLNISESGFMAETDGQFEVGSRVWLMLPGRERANAVVRWTAGDKIGAEFAEPVSLDGLERLSHRLAGAARRLGVKRLLASDKPASGLQPPRGSLVGLADERKVCHADHCPAMPGSLMSGAITPFTASMRSIIAPAAAGPTGSLAGFPPNAPSARPRCRWPRRACARTTAR